MSKTYVYSDSHFYHKNIVKFTNYDGSKLRPWDDCEKMTEDMILWYNEIVRPEDRVYILGDVAFTAANMRRALERMMGRKCLVLGNHDPKKLSKYFDLLDDVRGYIQRDGFIMSHIPIHPHCMGRWKVNIHGHLHGNTVMQYIDKGPEDLRYYNACVEHHDFRPVELDKILWEVGLKK